MKKYRVGILILMIITLGLSGYVLLQAAATKQDVQTAKKAREIADKLNQYVRDNQEIPENLDEAGVTDTPSTIRYSKKSDKEYEFCVTYQTDNSDDYNGLDTLLTGSITRDLSGYDQYDDVFVPSYKPSSLYLESPHKKGENCQTIQPYFYSSFNSRGSASTLSKTAQDTKRKTDINSLHARIEFYYAENAKYPTFSELNNASWRATNMKGFDNETLRDPANISGYSLVSAPRKNYYSYVPKGDGGTACSATISCTSYTLTATLSDNTTYVKQSLSQL